MSGWSPVDLLPGAWLGLLGLLLLSALARWYDRVPAAVAAVFTLVLLVLFGPVLLGGDVLLPLDNLRGQPPFQDLPAMEPHGNLLQGDLLELVAPSGVAVGRAFAAGGWPLWNPLVGAGMPLLGDPQAQALQPLVLLTYPLPWARAAGVTAALRVLVALVFTFLLLRRQGLHAGPSLAGSLAFGLSGFLLLWVGWPVASSAALLPVLLYALARCDGAGTRRDFLLLFLAVMALLLGGHPETIVYALALALAFLLDRLRRRPRGVRLQLLQPVAIAVLLAAGTAAPALLAAAETLPASLRAARLTAGSAALPPAAAAPLGDRLTRRGLPTLAPNAYGNSRFLDYWGWDNTNEDAAGFAGTATLLAALLALGARRRFPQELLFLGAAGAALGLMLLGVSFPALARQVPALGGGRLLLVVAFGVAYAAACTLERAREEGLARRPVLLVVLVLAALLVWAYVGHPDPTDPDRLALLRWGWLRWQLRFLAAAALLLLALPRRAWTASAMGFLIAAELLLAHRPANPPAPRSLLLPENAAVRFLAEHLGEDRFAGLGLAFPPNVASLYGLADARVYNPAAPQAYLAALGPVITGWHGEMAELGHPEDPLYRRLGVRYILTAPAASCPPPLATAFRDATATICEVAGPQPRLDLAPPGKLLSPAAEGTHLSAQLVAGPGAILQTSVYQDGGWHLLAGGHRLPIRAAGPFLEVFLPAGTERLDLLYRPRGWLAGCLLAALSLALAAVCWVPPPQSAFRAPPAPVS